MFDKIVKKQVMTTEQFREFMKDKILYHHNVHWIEIWKGSSPIEEYIPCDEFILPNNLTLKRYGYAGYSERCLGTQTTEGKSYWEYKRWRATISDKNGKIYVRELAPDGRI